MELQLDEQPEWNGKYLRTIASVRYVISDSNIIAATGIVMLNIERDSLSVQLKAGSILFSRSVFLPVKNMGNPGGFDYENYAALKGIFHQAYLHKNDWKLTGYSEPNMFRLAILHMRKFAVEAVDRFFPDNEEAKGVTKALLVGYKGDLDKELQQAYSNTGVIHVVAISGLHLGLVYLILINILSRIPGLKKKILLQSALCIAGLWIFSFVSGASASVLRSAVMFSFMLTGRALKYKGSIFNALASSAFFLLLYNPYFLWDIGFQLSYLAVIGIVTFQDPLYRLVFVKNPVVRYIWKASSVSISAQFATLPACLFYFHQFPVYFLIANLIVVPLSSAILILGFAVIGFSWLPALATVTGKLCYYGVCLMNGIVKFIDRLPGATIPAIYFNSFSLLLLSLAVFFLFLSLRKNKPGYLNVSLASIAALLFVHSVVLLSKGLEPKIIFYNLPRQTAVHFIDRRKSLLVADSGVISDPKFQSMIVYPALANLGGGGEKCNRTLHDGKIFEYYNKKIIVVDAGMFIPAPVDSCDILLLTQNARIDLTEMLHQVKPQLILFDGSNSLWKIAKWKSICEQLALPCFSIPEQGAFIYYPLLH